MKYDSMKNELDTAYLSILIDAIRVCSDYRPKLGHGASAGYSLKDFQKLYRADPFFNWMGLDNPLMYAAHKAAGGMTSIYRQIGIGCENLFRRILRDSLGLSDEEVAWSYTIRKGQGKTRTPHLDGCIPLDRVGDVTTRNRIERWIRACAADLEISKRVSDSLQGVVFEVRQGYKSKDSKRQNADIANATTAYTKGFLPCAAILSLQIDDSIALRYRNEKWVLLTGNVTESSPLSSVYSFMKDVIGFDLAGFFRQHSPALKKEVNTVLASLLVPQ